MVLHFVLGSRSQADYIIGIFRASPSSNGSNAISANEGWRLLLGTNFGTDEMRQANTEKPPMIM